MIKIIALIMSIAIFTLLVGVYLAPDDLSRCEPRPGTGKCASADAIVAISGGDTRARTREAVSLYQRGWAPKLVFSGAAADKSGPSNASAMRAQAIAAGVPEGAIITEDNSETTHENARLSGDVLAGNNLTRVILVTSAYHQRRASIEFQQNTDGKTEVVNHPVSTDKQWLSWWWATPTGWWLALSELVKIILVYVGAPR